MMHRSIASKLSVSLAKMHRTSACRVAQEIGGQKEIQSEAKFTPQTHFSSFLFLSALFIIFVVEFIFLDG